MANYAKNLIGKWETEQYEPLREVALAQYQNNWDRLTNDFNNLKDTLQRNQEVARTNYADTLSKIQDNSYNRMYNMYNNLASRGLSGSGLVDKAYNLNTRQTGSEVNDALTNLLSVSTEGVDALANANNTLASKRNSLVGGLADDLAGISDAEAGNAQKYANLLGDIGERAAQRASANASSGAGTKDEEQSSELERRIMIYDVLTSDKSDIEKVRFMANNLDVPAEIGSKAVESYNNNIDYVNKNNELIKLGDKLKSSKNYSFADNLVTAIAGQPAALMLKQNKINKLSNTFDKLKNELNGMSYNDLYDTLYGSKSYRLK